MPAFIPSSPTQSLIQLALHCTALAVARVGIDLLAVDAGLHHGLGRLHLPPVGQDGSASGPPSAACPTHSPQVLAGLLGEVEQDDVVHL